VETLEDRIAREGPVQELDAVGWAVRLAKRLEALHALGVAHGSVSPACVITQGSERGSKAILADVLRTSSSLSFQSPERITGGDLSPADDTWAVAATLYMALTGSPPFAGANDAETRQKILAASPAPLAVFDVGDDDLQHILDSAFTRDAGRRLATASALRRALEEWHPDPDVRKLSPLDEEESTDDGEDADDARTMMRASPFIIGSLPLPRRPPPAAGPPPFAAAAPPFAAAPPPFAGGPPAPPPVAAPPPFIHGPPARPVQPVVADAADEEDDDEDDNVRTMMRELPEHLLREGHAPAGGEKGSPAIAQPAGGRASYPDLPPARAPMPLPHRPVPPAPVSRPGAPKPLVREDSGDARTRMKPPTIDADDDDDDADEVRTVMREAPPDGWPEQATEPQRPVLPALREAQAMPLGPPGWPPPGGNNLASTQAFPAMSDEPDPARPLPLAGGQRWPQGGPAPSHTIPFPAVQDLDLGPPPAPPPPPQAALPGGDYPGAQPSMAGGQPSMEMMLQGPMGQMGPVGQMVPGPPGPMMPGLQLPRPSSGRRGMLVAAVIALLFAAGVTFILLRFRGLLQR
jgi:hypothetical protein